MANEIQTVSAQEIRDNGDGTFFIRNKLYSEYATGQYQQVGSPTNLIDGPRSTRNQVSDVSIPDNERTTDILFVQAALGEGPLYRILPDGPQGIEIDKNTPDDSINLDGDGDLNTDNMVVDYRYGTYNQSAMRVFGQEVSRLNPYSNPITLKKGNLSNPNKVNLQDTTPQAWDQLRFNFSIQALYRLDDDGNYHARNLRLRITVYDRTASTILVQRELSRTGKVTSEYKITETITIPEASRSRAGYKFHY